MEKGGQEDGTLGQFAVRRRKLVTQKAYGTCDGRAVGTWIPFMLTSKQRNSAQSAATCCVSAGHRAALAKAGGFAYVILLQRGRTFRYFPFWSCHRCVSIGRIVGER
eukprot:219459-Rhodomonas_salina.1